MIKHLHDGDDNEDLLQLAQMSRRSIHVTKAEDWIPGRKVHVITTNSARPAIFPAASRKARPKTDGAESLKEKRDRLRREIAELEGKRGKK